MTIASSHGRGRGHGLAAAALRLAWAAVSAPARWLRFEWRLAARVGGRVEPPDR